MTSTNLLYIYVIIINVVTFFIYGLDKSRAKAGQVITKTDDIEDIYFLFSGNEGIILRL